MSIGITKLAWIAAALLTVWALKRVYADVGADDLHWILGPTASVAGAATGTRFEVEPGAGYMSRERLFLIEKSCAGVNFMIAAFALSAYVLRRRVADWWSGAGTYAACLITAYVAAVVVNATRIAIAVWLGAFPAPSHIGSAQLHRLEGIVVYFGGLLLLHEVVVRTELVLDVAQPFRAARGRLAGLKARATRGRAFSSSTNGVRR